jgi:hypothetical protein
MLLGSFVDHVANEETFAVYPPGYVPVAVKVSEPPEPIVAVPGVTVIEAGCVSTGRRSR